MISWSALAGLAVLTVGATSAVALFHRQLHRASLRELEQTRAQLVAADRLMNLGRSTAGIAHELKTPLASAMNDLRASRELVSELIDSIGHPQVELADLREIAADLRVCVHQADAAVNRAGTFVGQLREHTRDLSRARLEKFTLLQRLETVRVFLDHRAAEAGVTLDFSGVDARVELWGDPGKADQVFSNLLLNAIEAIAESGTGGRVAVRATQSTRGVDVVVEDDGPGVPDEARDRIFEMLFTTRQATGGTGIGLAICRNLMEGVFGGTLVLQRSAQGARFALSFPAGAARASNDTAGYRPFDVPGVDAA